MDLPRDVPAGPVAQPVEVAALLPAQVAVGTGAGLGVFDRVLLAHQVAGLSVGQLAGGDPMADASFLVIAPVAVGRCGGGEAPQGKGGKQGSESEFLEVHAGSLDGKKSGLMC
jgi:hypothetical protein